MSGSQRVCTCRFCGRDDLTPQGHTSHERWCDDNPNRGITYEQQEELGILESNEGAATEGHPNPDQSVSADPSGGLPSVETLSPEKSGGETRRPATDGGEVAECPLCGHDEVLPADEAKDAYMDAVDHPHPKAVLGYELADHACQNPECAALWGEKYDEPLPMETVVNA